MTCTAVSAGGTTSKSVTLKRDATLPWLDFGTPTPAPNANGWHSGDVSIPFEPMDALSGIRTVTLPSPIVISQEGAGVVRSVTVVDNAGNSLSLNTPSVNIDRTPPGVTPTISGAVGNNGWYTSDVQVAWQILEIPASIVSSHGCETSSVTKRHGGRHVQLQRHIGGWYDQ